jgi:uncharacterized phiE125 gp8 family phage protein
MTPILVDGPAVEPVGLAEMRAYLRVDDAAEDELVTGLVKAARLFVEASSRRILTASRWRVLLDGWPSGRIVHLPLSPLIGVERIAVTSGTGEAVDLPSSAFVADRASDPPRILIGAEAPEPGVGRAGIAIELVAGYGTTADAVPEPLRLAVKMLVARWFEHRGDIAGEQTLPPEALALLTPFRRARL